MPTGYTAGVQDGSVTDFSQFAMQCARAFGALIMMRDDPIDAPIPEEFPPSTHHEEQIEEARLEVARLNAMTVDQREAAARAAHNQAVASWTKREIERKEQLARYEAMLAQVRAWQPPSPDHDKFKEFMVSQLTDSIEWDCRPSERPTQMKRDEWHEEALRSAEWSLNYHIEGQQKENERSAGRTQWVRLLRMSLSGRAAAGEGLDSPSRQPNKPL